MLIGVTPTILRPLAALERAIDAFLWNPSDAYAGSGTFSNGNKTVSESPGSDYVSCRATSAIGLNLARIRVSAPNPVTQGNMAYGLATTGAAFNSYSGMTGSAGTYFYTATGNIYRNGSLIGNNIAPAYNIGDTVDVAFDGSNVSWYKNGALAYSIARTAGETGALRPCVSMFNSTATFQIAGEGIAATTTWNNNPSQKNTDIVLANGALKVQDSTGSMAVNGRIAVATVGPFSVNKVFEIIVGPFSSTISIGLCNGGQDKSAKLGGSGNNSLSYASSGDIFLNGTAIVTGLPYTSGDAIMVCYSAGQNGNGGSVWFLKNGALAYGTQPPGTGGITTPQNRGNMFPAVDLIGANASATLNCGQSSFVNSIPSGFTPWG